MSSIPALRRETHALRSLHHTIGLGLRKLKSRVGQVDIAVLNLTSAASKEIVGCIARRSAHLAATRQPQAKWPDWKRKTKPFPGRCAGGRSPSGEHSVEAETAGATMPPHRTLKAHASDESTAMNEDAPPLWEFADEACSSNSSICDSAGISGNSMKSGRPGRRQKARRRQREWEEANRRCYLDAALSTSQGDSSSWALGALTSVFEDLVEDDYDSMENACAARADSHDYEDQSDREDWQYNLGKIDVLTVYAAALEHIPSTITESYCDFRQAALEVKLTSVVALRSAIFSIEPCVANLEKAREASKLWKGPEFLKASWMYLLSHTLGKPLSLLQHMQECYNELMIESRHGPDYFEKLREDLNHRLENSVTAFEDDMKVFQYAMDKEGARRLVRDPIQMPLARTASEAQVAERMRVQGMSQDELQVLLSFKSSKK